MNEEDFEYEFELLWEKYSIFNRNNKENIIQ